MVKTIIQNEIVFICEHDGEIEREFKNELSKFFFKTGLNIRAYLALTKYQDVKEYSVALCLVIDKVHNELILKQYKKIFRSKFSSEEYLDILFIDKNQESDLRTICCPFYTSENFQVNHPDFYLLSSEGYGLDKIIRNCFKRKKLYGLNPDGYLLCDIDPVIVGQAFNLGDRDIKQVIIASRHKKFSLFPIIDWPCYVHIARSLISPENLNHREDSDMDLIAWAELYEKKEDINMN